MNAVQKSPRSLINAQIRGDSRNTQSTDTIEQNHIKNAPKVGVIQNPQIRGNTDKK